MVVRAGLFFSTLFLGIAQQYLWLYAPTPEQADVWGDTLVFTAIALVGMLMILFFEVVMSSRDRS